MADAVVDLAWEEAERSSPAVRAGALMRLARAQSASDRAGARKTFERGLNEARQISGRDGESLMEDAPIWAAAVAPDMLAGIPLTGRKHMMGRRFKSEKLGRTMLAHGHVDAAYDYVIACDDSPSFPFSVVHALLDSLGAERRLALLRRAIESWRAGRNDPFIHGFDLGFDNGFDHLFNSKWNLLPDEEARTVVREIVRASLDEPEQQMNAHYDPDGTIEITSRRAHSLFQVLHILRRLDEPLAQTLIASHDQLAKAAERFPNGMESVMEEAEARRKAAGPPSCGGFFMMGDRRDFKYIKALRQASEDGDFRPTLEFAQKRYLEDVSPERPNEALKESWPSSCMFRSILYRAGKKMGEGAATYLDWIPDADQRLFARIELAAALAGLPELQETQRGNFTGPGGPPRKVPHAPVNEVDLKAATERAVELRAQGVVIRCPQCKATPVEGAWWICRCGHRWNTFETGGICPECRHQWKATGCLYCREWSPHSAWYVEPNGPI